MSWYRKAVIRILLLVAQLMETDAGVRLEIKQLAQHIEVWMPKEPSR